MQKNFTARKLAKTHRHLMTRARLMDAFTSLPDAFRWSLGVRSGEASAQNEAARAHAGRGVRLVLKQYVSLCIRMYLSGV